MIKFLNKKNKFIGYKYYWLYNGFKAFNSQKKISFEQILKKDKSIVKIFDNGILNYINIPILLIKKNLINFTIYKIKGNEYIEFNGIIFKIIFYENYYQLLFFFLKISIIKFKENLFFIKNKILHIINYFKIKHKGQIIKKIDFNEFKKLEFYDQNNNLDKNYRLNHLNIITNNKEKKTIGEIIDYINIIKHDSDFKKNIIQPKDISLDKDFPRFIDENFWFNGNAYYINCILNSFKINIINYENVETMRCADNNEIFFSENYYKSKKNMEIDDIKKIFELDPIKVKNNTIISGRHRVCAMIGRILNNEKYLQIKIIYEN